MNPSTAQSAIPDYHYDVFVSYSHKDKEWVDRELVPCLRSEKLSVLTDDEFRAGLSVTHQMKEAVAICRRTLLVMTPDWEESRYAAFESARAHGRVVPLLLKECKIPGTLSNLIYRSYLKPTTKVWRQLLRDLAPEGLETKGNKPPAGAEREVKKGLDALHDAMERNSEVRRAIERFGFDREEVLRTITEVEDYKAAHKELQRIELQLRPLDQQLQPSRTADLDWILVASYAGEVEGQLSVFESGLEASCFAGEERQLISSVKALQADLDQAVEGESTELLVEVVGRCQVMLGLQLPRMNRALVLKAGDRSLRRLVDWLAKVSQGLEPDLADESVRATLREATQSLKAKVDEFQDLVGHHAAWQEVHDYIRIVEEKLFSGREVVAWEWQELMDRASALVQRGAVVEDDPFITILDCLNKALGDHQGPSEIGTLFVRARSKTIRSFSRVDDEMLEHCGYFHALKEPLEHFRESAS